MQLNVFKDDFKKLGLIDKKGELTLGKENIKALRNGCLTEWVRLENINLKGTHVDKIDVKLLIAEGEQGAPTLMFFPGLKNRIDNSYLSALENKLFQKGVHEKIISGYGKLKNVGRSPFRNVLGNPSTFYVDLEKADDSVERMWGDKIEEALEEADLQIGDEGCITVDLKKPGKYLAFQFDDAPKVKSVKYLYEYDKGTKSMVGVNSDKFLIPDRVNDTNLEEGQKQKLKEGKKIDVGEGTQLQASPASSNGFNTNRAALVASVLFDGGISYVLIKGVGSLLGRLNKDTRDQDEELYRKKYLDAVKSIQRDLLHKLKKYPNDPDIKHDLEILNKELSSPTLHQKVNSLKSKVNDHDLEGHAAKKEEEGYEFKHKR